MRRIRPGWWFRIVFALVMIAFMTWVVASRVAHERGHQLEGRTDDSRTVGRRSDTLWAEERLPVAAEFGDGFADVVERSVGAALLDAGEQGGVPEAG